MLELATKLIIDNDNTKDNKKPTINLDSLLYIAYKEFFKMRSTIK